MAKKYTQTRSWDAATQAPVKCESVAPHSHKSFGPKMDEKEATPVTLKGKTPLSWAGHSKKGSEDIGKTGTMAPNKGADVARGNRPTANPPAFQR